MADEYIRREDAIDAATQDSTENRTHSFRAGQARSASRIKALPSADVVPVVHGYWFVDERPESDREVICSVCEEPVFKYHDHIDWRLEYCPHCGAKMDGGDEHETN